MFFDAMLTAGVEETKAKIMYAAVYHFGPRWKSGRERRVRGFLRSVKKADNTPTFDKGKFQEIIKMTGNKDLSLSQIEGLLR